MGNGPNGSGVTITPAEQHKDDRSPQERAYDERVARRKALDEHRARQDAFTAEQKQLYPELEDKQAAGPAETKAES